MLASGAVVAMALRASGAPHEWRQAIVPLMVTFAALWAAAGAIAFRLSRPYVELERVAKALGRGESDARFSLTAASGAESRIIGAAINDMADRLGEQLADQRALLAAVSHELRTPMARMRLLIELARESASPGRSLDELDAEVVEIDQLVSQLLAASRLDFSALTVRKQDWAGLARRAMERAQVPVESLEIRDFCQLDGDATLLALAMGNLIANAVGHGGGVTAVRVGTRAGAAFFEVDDGGAGFDEAQLPRVFEPFREGRGRAPGPRKSGMGFGLALVRRIAEAHGGGAYAANREGGGARVGFTIPTPDGATQE